MIGVLECLITEGNNTVHEKSMHCLRSSTHLHRVILNGKLNRQLACGMSPDKARCRKFSQSDGD